MLKNRVIPCLLISERRLVKTRKFKKPSYVGDPVNAVRIFNEKEVDELIILDIEASKRGKPPDFAYIEEIASECFMPLAYGGGIRSVDDAEKLFSLGVEKVCLQTSVLDDISLIHQISDRFGCQSVVLSVDLKKSIFGKYRLYSSSMRKIIKNDYMEYIQSSIPSGVGELVLNVVDNDGCMHGMDFDLIEKVSSQISIPMVAMGGAGSLEDIKHAIKSGASAVAAGALFVYQGPHRAVLISYPKHVDLERILT